MTTITDKHSHVGRRYISDLETNGLLPEVSVIHCAVLKDIDTGEARGFRPHEIDEYFRIIVEAKELWFHNGINYDYRVIRKLHPSIKIKKHQVKDTMVLGRLAMPDIKGSDFDRLNAWRSYQAFLKDNEELLEEGKPPQEWAGMVPHEFPGQMCGRYSLEAWGYRLGCHKGNYTGGWTHFNEDMFDYMMQDAEVTHLLYHRLMARGVSPQALELEHRFAWLTDKIERNGFPFNMKEAAKLLAKLVDEREALRRKLVGLFPNWKVRLPDFIPARNNQTKGYIKDVPVPRWKEFEFNPASRAHIENRFKSKYSWKPVEFTQEAFKCPATGVKIQPGSAKIDDEILQALPYPEASQLARFFLLDKRISQLSEGGQGWMKLCTPEGKVHARYTPNGAATGRATHSKPNISAVPRVSSEFGWDCRALFGVPSGWVQMGADQQGLELRCLASDLAHAGDGGAYAIVVTTGDVHTTNQHAAGLFSREDSKTFIYAFIYGGGDGKLGSIAGGNSVKGKALRSSFLTKTPGLETLIKTVKAAARNKGSILGIDKRTIPTRSEHSALNFRLQNAGAVVCKQWGCDWDDALKAAGLKHGWDGDYVFLSNSHDEYQLAVRDDPELIALVDRLGRIAGQNAGKPFNFKCPLDIDVKMGRHWAECH
jgi:DNA polymerase-1